MKRSWFSIEWLWSLFLQILEHIKDQWYILASSCSPFTPLQMHWPFFDIQHQFISSSVQSIVLLLMIACLIWNGNTRKRISYKRASTTTADERSSHLSEEKKNTDQTEKQKKIRKRFMFCKLRNKEKNKSIYANRLMHTFCAKWKKKFPFFHQFVCTLIDRSRKCEKKKNVSI